MGMGKLAIALWAILAAATGAEALTPTDRCARDLDRLGEQAPVLQDASRGTRLWEPLPGVFVLLFDSQESVARTFLRFQEHYESPRFRRRVFHWRDYVRWYSQEQGHGHFTYFHDWSGYNFPSSNLEPFFDGRFNPLTPREQWLVDLLRPHRRDRFYVVATFSEEKGGIPAGWSSVLRHELAHALFYLDPAYRRQVQAALAGVDRAPIYRWLSSMGGYHPEVLEDEMHAYLLNDADKLERHGIDLAPYRQVMSRLTELFDEAYDRRKPE